MKNIIISLFVIGLVLPSCYKDLGNYTYKDINEIEIEGIEKEYARDVDDSLIISPSLKGTQYSDTSMFEIKWVIDGREKGTSLELRTQINQQPGRREGSLTLTDKKTSVQKFSKFYVNVTSSTASDLFMVLSKSKGKAELSYLRLDKPSNFAINYYEERTGKPLGIQPQQLCMIDLKSGYSQAYPFSRSQGRFIALVDNNAYLFDKHTLGMDTVTNHLSLETYTGLASYPPVPDDVIYKSEFTLSIVDMWRTLANGTQQEGTKFAEISNGTLYRFSFASNNPAGYQLLYNIKPGESEYPNSYLSPFCFYDDIYDAPNDYPWVQGNVSGNLMVFDKVNGRFAYGMNSYIYEIKLEHLKAFKGYELIWGTDTDQSALCLAILANNSGETRMVLINKAKDTGIQFKYTLAGEVVTSNVINKSTKFFAMKKSANIFFVTGNKLYCYNTLEASTGTPPSEKNLVATLSDFGYDDTATITDLFISRTERTILLGVSRYGSDTEAMDDENKGDLVVLNLTTALKVSLNEIHKGISGLPVDVQIKYQTHYRDGKNKDGSYVDKY